MLIVPVRDSLFLFNEGSSDISLFLALSLIEVLRDYFIKHLLICLRQMLHHVDLLTFLIGIRFDLHSAGLRQFSLQ